MKHFYQICSHFGRWKFLLKIAAAHTCEKMKARTLVKRKRKKFLMALISIANWLNELKKSNKMENQKPFLISLLFQVKAEILQKRILFFPDVQLSCSGSSFNSNFFLIHQIVHTVSYIEVVVVQSLILKFNCSIISI